MVRRVSVLILVLLYPLSALAYVDPGTGLILWQGLIAALGAVLLFVRRPWQGLKRLLNSLTSWVKSRR